MGEDEEGITLELLFLDVLHVYKAGRGLCQLCVCSNGQWPCLGEFVAVCGEGFCHFFSDDAGV